MTSLGLRLSATDVVAVRLDPDGAREALRIAAEEAPEALAEWAEAAGSRVGGALHGPLHHRLIRFPFTQPKKIRQVLPIELGEHVPGSLADFERHVEIGEDATGGYASVGLIDAELAATARATVQAISSGARALEPEALLMSEGAAADADLDPASPHGFLWFSPGMTTVVVRGERPPAAFSVPIGLDHLEDEYALANLRNRIVAGLDDPIGQWVVDGWGRDDARIAGLLDRVAGGGAWRWRRLDPDAPVDPAERVALTGAVAAVERYRPVWNMAPRRPLINPELLQHPVVRTVAVPAGVLLLMLAVAFQTGTAVRAAKAEAYRNELGAIYQRNFPDARIVDPVRQMRSVVDRGGGTAGGPTGPIIERLKSFNQTVSAGTDLTLTELRTAGGEWLLKGEAPNFGAVDGFKASLEELGWTENVRVQRAEQTVDNTAIRFQLAFADGGGA